LNEIRDEKVIHLDDDMDEVHDDTVDLDDDSEVLNLTKNHK